MRTNNADGRSVPGSAEKQGMLGAAAPGRVSLRGILALLYAYPLRKLAAVLPPAATRFISIPFIYLYSVLPISRERRRKISNTWKTAFAGARSESDLKKLTRKCLRTAAYTFVDDMILVNLDWKGLRRRGSVQGIEHLEKALAAGKGVILVSGHFSGDRVGKVLLREIGHPVLSVTSKGTIDPSIRTMEQKYFVPLMKNTLCKILQDYICIEDRGFDLEILKRLRENGIVSILIDARAGTHKKHCPFLGGERIFATNFLQIARLTGAAVIPMLCIGDSRSFSVIIDKQVELMEFPTKEEFISGNLITVVNILEAQIRQYPAQWPVL